MYQHLWEACDFSRVRLHGYYFSTRYPGEDSIELDKSDINQCGWAILHCREAILQMIKEIEMQNDDIIISDDEIKLQDNKVLIPDDVMEL